MSSRHDSSTPTFLNPRSPPPPPPKSSHATPTNQQTRPTSGPPLPPPPPSSAYPSASLPTQPSQTPSVSQPPSIEEGWLPEIVLEKQTSALQPLLQSPSHLTALSTLHPSIDPSPLLPYLSQTESLAQHTLQEYTRLLSLRRQVQNHLLQLRSQERQWHQKQSQIDKELEPWSAKALYQRLVAREREGEDWTRSIEESFLEGEGIAGERELVEFLRRWREGRRGVGKRGEERARWDEGRVGGWR